MALLLSFFTGPFTSAIGAISAKFASLCNKFKKRPSSTSESAPPRSRPWNFSVRPHGMHPSRSSSGSEGTHEDRASESSNGTVDTETLVGESDSCPYSAPQVARKQPVQPPPLMLRGNTISYIHECPADEGDVPLGGFWLAEKIEPDLERIAAEDYDNTVVPHADRNIKTGLRTDPFAFGRFGRKLVECPTALSPPPLHLSGKTRSEVVFLPRDIPGCCPVHGCQGCTVCDTENPAIFRL